MGGLLDSADTFDLLTLQDHWIVKRRRTFALTFHALLYVCGGYAMGNGASDLTRTGKLNA